MNQGDIYLISLDPTLGHEQQGKRPVFVISPKSFNLITKMPIVLPITSGGNFARNMGFAVELIGGKTTGIVRCDQYQFLYCLKGCSQEHGNFQIELLLCPRL